MVRRLAAIVAADVANYSRLMHEAEEFTHQSFDALLSHAIVPAIHEHEGRIVKSTGDGFLAEFSSAVQAVKCAAAFQRTVHDLTSGDQEGRRLAFRVGVHLADVMAESGDIYGDGVNIAARLEGLSDPGGILVSAPVYENVLGRLPCDFEDIGDQQLKNIARPVRAYRVVGSGQATRPTLQLPDKPSIAVMPFQNLSGEPEQEYFADGMVEEIITALSRVRWLFVIARNSSFAYKAKPLDIRQVGRELGVRYVLEGSVRKAGGRVRIAGQLVDAASGTHLWAERFDATLDDVFELQDQVTSSVVAAIEPRLRLAEVERAQRKPTANLQAYDLLLRAQPGRYSSTRQELEEASGLLQRATELDPHYGLAFAHLAKCRWSIITQGWTDLSDARIEAAVASAGLALEYTPDDPEVLSVVADVIAFAGGDLSGGIELAEKSAALSPNSAGAFRVSGMLRAYAGDTERAILDLERALRLNPLDRIAFSSFGFIVANFVAGRYEETLNWTERGLRVLPYHAPTLRYRAASFGLLDRIEQGQQAVRRLLAIIPDYTVADVKRFVERGMHNPFRTKGAVEALYEGLRKAGLR